MPHFATIERNPAAYGISAAMKFCQILRDPLFIHSSIGIGCQNRAVSRSQHRESPASFVHKQAADRSDV